MNEYSQNRFSNFLDQGDDLLKQEHFSTQEYVFPLFPLKTRGKIMADPLFLNSPGGIASICVSHKVLSFTKSIFP